ncbi:DNA cytosine methyltransferase [Enterobacter sp. MF024]|uniref:DNA cytosine methyltransferase n=1 Tax=Enterobacter sp. MF024 TaxID=2555644 RepID=UPI0011064938|nr:DNA cytosine methyltransferase [Enterobacter sp. MF024]TLU69576.1 DNA cytosine methyltransferase [Enterobacter sp. MF024]
MTAYYNEIDPFAAQWLRNLIDAGHIAPGVVDTRSIEEVTANDLKGFTQCHFFAGIGVWSYALRRAGWPDDRPVWTGSCPCQPFSACGKKAGKSDRRHLWPVWFDLLSKCRPGVVFGEQVASKDGLDWLDDVQANLEGAAYAFAALDLCAAGFGAPHIRQRLFWVADSKRKQHQKRLSGSTEGYGQKAGGAAVEFTGLCLSGGLEHSDSNGREGRIFGRKDSKREDFNGSVGCNGTTCGLADTDNKQRSQAEPAKCADELPGERGENSEKVAGFGGNSGADAVSSFWGIADWLFCHDGKWRPVKPGLKPLVDGVAGRVGQLRAFGNAIVAPVAEEFIAAYMEGCP